MACSQEELEDTPWNTKDKKYSWWFQIKSAHKKYFKNIHMDCLVVLLEKSTSTWIRKWSFLLLWSRTEHIFLITNRWWVKRCGVAINQEVPPRTFVSALSATCLSQGVTTSSIMTDSTMCLGLLSVVTVILTHSGMPLSLAVLIPASPRAFDPIKLIIKTQPLRSCRKWQAISEESFVHKIKKLLNIATFKVGGARPPCKPNTQHVHSNRRWGLIGLPGAQEQGQGLDPGLNANDVMMNTSGTSEHWGGKSSLKNKSRFGFQCQQQSNSQWILKHTH